RYTDCSTVDVPGPIRDSSTKPIAMTAVPATGNILYRPVRPTMMPLVIEVASRPTTMGRVCNPDTVADTPSTNCMNVGRNDSAPSMAKPTTNESTQHTVKTGSAKSRIGRIGSLARSSTATNTASAATDPTNSPIIVGDPHG